LNISSLGGGARIAGALLAVAGLALATPLAADAAAININTGGSGPDKVIANCSVSAGPTTSTTSSGWVVYGTAVAFSTSGALAQSTTLVCTVANAGSLSSALLGPAAVVAGTVTLPLGQIPSVSACAIVRFSDGVWVNTCG
jgi:hypothetical protein